MLNIDLGESKLGAVATVPKTMLVAPKDALQAYDKVHNLTHVRKILFRDNVFSTVSSYSDKI